MNETGKDIVARQSDVLVLNMYERQCVFEMTDSGVTRPESISVDRDGSLLIP